MEIKDAEFPLNWVNFLSCFGLTTWLVISSPKWWAEVRDSLALGDSLMRGKGLFAW